MTSTNALRDHGLTWRAVDGEVVLLDLGSSRYFSVNSSGSLLWALLARGATDSELAAELERAYGLEPGQAGSDVNDFLRSLNSYGLLAGSAAQSST